MAIVKGIVSAFGRRSRASRRSPSSKKPRGSRLESLEARVLLAVVDDLRIAEIMYHPTDPAPGGAFVGRDFEYVELINTGSAAIGLDDVEFTDGIDFSFAAAAITTLDPGERVLVVSNQAAFVSRHGAGLPVAGEFTGSLSNSAETVELAHFTDGLIQVVSYDDAWHPNSDGNGFSLVMLDPAVDPARWDDPASWRASQLTDGSPGAAEPAIEADDVVINELLSHTDGADGDWIELHNTTTRGINVAGWFISDNPSQLTRFQIGGGRFIAPGGHVVFNQSDDFGNDSNPLATRPFGFSELGESAHVTPWDFNGGASLEFGAADREVPFGRYTRSDGTVMFVAMENGTPGRANSAPRVGPVVIHEIMYHPSGSEDGEFVELFNPTDAPVPLFHPLHPANTWSLVDEGGNEFFLPEGVTIEPGGFALIVAIDPAAFRAAHAIDPDVPVLGPFAGNLSNSGEYLELYRPGDPEPDLFVPRYLTDRVEYDDAAPWPTSPDGDGPSLARRSAGEFGDDVFNWRASRQPGGTPGAPNEGLAGDTNGDGRVDVVDLNNVRNHFGESGADVIGDANGDGRVDIVDLNAVRNNFGATAVAGANSRAIASSIAASSDAAQRRREALIVSRLPRRAVESRWRMAARLRYFAAWDRVLVDTSADVDSEGEMRSAWRRFTNNS